MTLTTTPASATWLLTTMVLIYNNHFCTLNWVCIGLPNDVLLLAPLQGFLEVINHNTRKKTCRSVARIQFASTAWGPPQLEVLGKCRKALTQLVTSDHFDTSHRVCVYINTRDIWLSDVATQITIVDLACTANAASYLTRAFLQGTITYLASLVRTVTKGIHHQ